MGRVTARAGALLVVTLLLAPAAGAQLPLPDDASALGPLVNPVYDTVAERAGTETGVDFTHEDVDIRLVLDFVNVELGFVGALFGGGKVQTDVDVVTNVTIRAVAVARLDDALRAASGDHDVSLNGTLGLATHRMVLTAGEIRTAGGGLVLDAFTRYQEDATRRYLEDTLPGLRVLAADFTWENTVIDPQTRDPDEVYGTDPPLVLNARLRLQYLDRISVLGLAPALADADPDDPQKQLKDRIKENQTVPLADRSAFMMLGVGQLMQLELPENWRLNLTLVLPDGFTVEGATHQFVVADGRQAASYVVEGDQAIRAVDAAGVVTISNRFLVTTLLTTGVLLAGLVTRAVVEAATWRTRGALRKRLPPGGQPVTIAPRGAPTRGPPPAAPPRTR